MKLSRAYVLLLSILGCEVAGAIGSIFTLPAIAVWYPLLQKPWFNPPAFVFAPVWVILYALMGIAVYIVWSKGRKSKNRLALMVFGVQLTLNVLWAILFFGLQSPLYGFICIIALWIAVLATTIAFYDKSRKAAYILAPYLIWVTFALALNLAILLLNG